MVKDIDKKVKKELKELELKYHKKFIDNLRQRGWALYLAGSAGISFTDLVEVEAVVSRGSEKNELVEGMAYQVLPYVEDDSNWEVVKEAMMYALANRRLPFYVDLMTVEDVEGKEEIRAIDVYLVDTVIYTKPSFELVIDYNLMTQFDIISENNGNIILNVCESHKLLKQLALARR